MYKLKVISSTVRPGRKGPIVAAWITDLARKNGNFDVELLDLGEIKLPMMDEPNHPVMRNYQHDHTKWWSAKIDEADAFIFVTAEYDYNYPAPLRNALEYFITGMGLQTCCHRELWWRFGRYKGCECPQSRPLNFQNGAHT